MRLPAMLQSFLTKLAGFLLVSTAMESKKKPDERKTPNELEKY